MIEKRPVGDGALVEDAPEMNRPSLAPDDALAFLTGGGEMGERIRAFDWAAHPLGPLEHWPQSLKTALRIILTSRQPFWIGWGKELTYFYNDPYKSIIGGKHPLALGQPAHVVWREIWDDIGPMLRTAMGGIEGTYVEEQLLIMERSGYPEETYYTFSYTPLPDDQGRTGGIICANTDDTDRVIGERQLATLSELATRTADARTLAEACNLSAKSLETNLRDLPFALLYLVESDGHFRLAATSGIERGHPAAPEIAVLDGDSLWPFAEVSRTHSPALVKNLERFGKLPTGAWRRSAHQAVVVPITSGGQAGKTGVLVAALNPFRLFDDRYRNFINLVAAQIAARIANAQAYEEERKRAEALAEIDRAKTAFFSNVSHEFRTPLTLLLGPAEEALADAETTSISRERLMVIHRNAVRLQKLVNTLLDFSRLEAGRAQAAYVETDLPALTSDLASMFRSAMEKAGLKYTVDCSSLPEPVFVDRDMWEKIVFNLLSNAFKFTLQGEVEVNLRTEEKNFTEDNKVSKGEGITPPSSFSSLPSVKNSGSCVVLTLRDTGLGIPPEELSNIFKRFHRIENVRGRTHEGTGIGLALVSELVKLHGGMVDVESELGRGTVFRVRIPFGKQHLPAEHVRPGHPHSSNPLATPFLEEALNWLPVETTSHQPPTTSNEQPTTNKPRILLAEDNADMRDYVHRLLRGDHTVESVPDGAAALALARENPPDLIVSDVMMPGMNGFELVQHLRADEKLRAIPIILLSARAGEKARVEGVSQGVDDYLTKPFSAQELLARIATQLKLARVRRQAQDRVTSILESLSDGFQLADASGRFTYMNPAARRMLGEQGVDPDALMGKHVVDEAFPETRDGPFGEAFSRALAERTTQSVENFYKPWQRWYAVRIYPAAEGGVSIYFQDVTTRKGIEAELGERLAQLEQANAELRDSRRAALNLMDDAVQSRQSVAESEERYRILFESIDEGFCTVDVIFSAEGKPVDYRFVQANPAFERLTGLQNALGKSARELLPGLEDFWFDAYGKVALTGESVRFENKSEPMRRWFEVHASRVGGPDSRRVAIVFSNVTDRKQAEELMKSEAKRLEVLVQQRTAKLQETIGELEAFSYTVAHDMRAPLRSMQSFANYLHKDCGEQVGSEGKDYIRRIISSAERMDRLIQDVLNYSKIARTELELEPVDLNKLVQGILESYPDLQPPKASVWVNGQLPFVLGNEAALTQCLSNLLGNAVKFVAPGVKPEVRVWADLVGKDKIRLYVRDNGIGIDAQGQTKIFGIFERLSKNYEGTGIGLSIVKKAAERMGGSVGLESAPGQGSTFWIELKRPKPG